MYIPEIPLPSYFTKAIRDVVASFKPADPSNPVEVEEAKEAVWLTLEQLDPAIEALAEGLKDHMGIWPILIRGQIKSQVEDEVDAAVERWNRPSLRTALRKFFWQSA